MRSILTTAGLLALALPIRASLIEFSFTGQVTFAVDVSNFLAGNVRLGDEVSGLFSYDTNTSPASLTATDARYDFLSGPSTLLIHVITPAGTILTLATDYSAGIDGLPPYEMQLSHDPGVLDIIGVSAFGSAATWSSLLPSIGPDNMGVSLLSTPPHSLVPNLALPTSIDVSQITSGSGSFGSSGLGGRPNSWLVDFDVTSLSEVPEPGSAVFAAVGLAILWWIQKRTICRQRN